MRTLEFFDGHVGISVNTLLVGAISIVEGDDISQVLFEGSLSGIVFVRFVLVSLVEVLQVLLESVGRELVPFGLSANDDAQKESA